MIFRIRRVITGALVCHLLLVPGMFTSRLLLHSQSEPRQSNDPTLEITVGPQNGAAAQEDALFPDTRSSESVTISAVSQEKAGSVYTLKGNVEIEFKDLLVRGDELTYDAASGLISSPSHISVDDTAREEHVEASRAVSSKIGRAHV